MIDDDQNSTHKFRGYRVVTQSSPSGRLHANRKKDLAIILMVRRY